MPFAVVNADFEAANPRLRSNMDGKQSRKTNRYLFSGCMQARKPASKALSSLSLTSSGFLVTMIPEQTMPELHVRG